LLSQVGSEFVRHHRVGAGLIGITSAPTTNDEIGQTAIVTEGTFTTQKLLVKPFINDGKKVLAAVSTAATWAASNATEDGFGRFVHRKGNVITNTLHRG